MNRTATALLLATAFLPLAAVAFPRHSYHVPRVKSYAPKAPRGMPSLHRGYINKSGVYVAPHYQTAPNRTKADNWSSKPNVNPITGTPGTKDPYAASH